ncbi:hypothetical protein RSOLAG1IB_09784 [Rhizoctonia solani AG-1 IB]|uniref:Uncharacterized protein n=1 Tax=Thanatephorus cucumeris (strain AG1-IB / isolate 7/3/14) TaxID=1108050 RepID=A0A0B7FYA0_THACB|nr:hypothetical protein RSOLAG1IB_09784 [Rhizoctonia solani AG-1 IB]
MYVCSLNMFNAIYTPHTELNAVVGWLYQGAPVLVHSYRDCSCCPQACPTREKGRYKRVEYFVFDYTLQKKLSIFNRGAAEAFWGCFVATRVPQGH